MSEQSIAIPEWRYNCAACGAEHSVPSSSIYRQPPLRLGLPWLVMGTCEDCHSSRTLWVEDVPPQTRHASSLRDEGVHDG
ncbi:MAG: hypothetical protein AAF846_30110 [Chloroflexota bacterium]